MRCETCEKLVGLSVVGFFSLVRFRIKLKTIKTKELGDTKVKEVIKEVSLC